MSTASHFVERRGTLVENELKEYMDKSWLRGRLDMDISHELSPKGNIFRIPDTLRAGNREAYDLSSSLTIGCYYYMSDEGDKLVPFKMMFLKHFLDCAQKNSLDLYSLLQIVNENLPKILLNYSDPIRFSGENQRYHFAEKILVNSAFLIEFFTLLLYPSQYDEYSLLCREVSTKYDDIMRDILLLENQLPLFIIHRLYKLVYGGNTHSFTDIVSLVFGFEDRRKVDIDPKTNESKCFHLLDLVWSYYEPSKRISSGYYSGLESKKRVYSNIIIVSPTATTLYEAGVKFRVASGNDKSKSLDIEFNKKRGILTIPKLSTEDPTMSLLKNMMAYEQLTWFFGGSNYVSDYLFFLDCLINTPRDVEVLVDAGIIENCLGCEAVCGMFNGISKNCKIDWREYIYERLSKQLIDHCTHTWNRHKATLKNKYFGHPWAVISVISAAALLILTLVQVTTGILSVPGVLR